ncbi:MAG: hypothetical protein AAB875_03570 [Patescibacteria group bacterium]|mgnify:CR=1 FL=1
MKKATKENARQVIKDMVDIINQCQSQDEEGLVAGALRDIITSLRGPDFKDIRNWKMNTTSKIRHIIGMNHRSGLAINDNIDEIVEVVTSNYTETASHFLSHIKRAKKALKLLEYI